MIPTMIPTLTRARLIPSILISQSSNIVQMDGWMDGWMCQEYVLYYRIAMRESVLWIYDVIWSRMHVASLVARIVAQRNDRSLLLEKIAGGGLKEGEMLLLSWPPPKRKIEGFQESLQAI